MTVGGLHTLISNLTINAAGNVYVNGVIDGGGVLNANGAAPGSITFPARGVSTPAAAARFRSALDQQFDGRIVPVDAGRSEQDMDRFD